MNSKMNFFNNRRYFIHNQRKCTKDISYTSASNKRVESKKSGYWYHWTILSINLACLANKQVAIFPWRPMRNFIIHFQNKAKKWRVFSLLCIALCKKRCHFFLQTFLPSLICVPMVRMEALESQWEHLNLIEEDLLPINVDEGPIELDNRKSSRSLMGKIYSNIIIGK